MANINVKVDGDTSALEEKLERLGETGKQALGGLLDGLREMGELLGAAGIEFGRAFEMDALNALCRQGIEAMLAAISDACTFAGGENPGETILAEIAGRVADGAPQLAGASAEMVAGAVDAASREAAAQTPALGAIGGQLVDGVAAGVTANTGALATAMQSLISAALAAAAERAEINSPSRLFEREVGRWIPAGIAAGVEAGTPAIVDAVENQAGKVLAAYKGLELEAGIDTAGLADSMRGMFDDVPDAFFTMGETAGGQFVAGFDAAAFAYFALFENMMAGDVLLAGGTSAGSERAGQPVEIHFHDEVQAPDAVARAVRNVFEYGLAGERN